MASLRLMAALALLAACGETAPDAQDGPCAGQPCLTRVDDEADWTAISEPHAGARCDFATESKYLAPVSATSPMPHTVFQDVKVHRLHLEFMHAVLGEWFAGLGIEDYARLVTARATRQYWAGALYRVVDASGATLGWGFDVNVDPSLAAEQLSEQEVAAVRALLMERFHLPLAYAPSEAQAIAAARSFTQFPVYLPRACDVAMCDDPAKNCLTIPAAVSGCGHFMEGRSIELEHARKIRLDLASGTHKLGREPGGAAETVTLVTGGAFGPARTPLVAATPGRYQVVLEFGYLSYVYTQTLTAGADTIELRWNVPFSEQNTSLTVEEPWMSDFFYVGGSVNESTMWEDTLVVGSCTAQTLERWRATGTLAGGDSFTLDFRYTPPGAGSGPLLPTAAQVVLGGQSVSVTDYFDLVYAGEHHNWNNQYRVLFATPITYAGHLVHGLWWDEAPTSCCPLDGVYTLDANLDPLDTLTVVDYAVGHAP